MLAYRERVSYHESVEEELKRNIEGQVDVVLRMEEERLLLMKDSKEVREKNKALVFENEDYRQRIALFESELDELKVQVREQAASVAMRKQAEFSGDDADESDASKGKENVSANIKKKALVVAKKPAKKATTTLKFQPAMSKATTLPESPAVSTPSEV